MKTNTAQKNDVFHYGFLQSRLPNLQFPVDLVPFAENILNGKLHFLCRVNER